MAIHHPTKSRTSRAAAGRIAKSNSAAVSSVGARPAARHLEIMVSPRSAIAYFVAANVAQSGQRPKCTRCIWENAGRHLGACRQHVMSGCGQNAKCRHAPPIGSRGNCGRDVLALSLTGCDPVRTMVGDGFRSNRRSRSYRRRDGGDQNGDGRRAPRPCSGRPASRLHSSQTPPRRCLGELATRDSVRLAETVSPWHVSPSWTIEEGARMAAVRAHHIFR